MATKQHHIPRYWLRQFARLNERGKHVLYFFDIENGIMRATSPENVAHEKNFYDWHEPDGKLVKIDEVLTEADDFYAPYFVEMCANPAVDKFRQSVYPLASIFAMQDLRSKALREALEGILSNQRPELKDGDDEQLIGAARPDDLKAIHAYQIKENFVELAEYLSAQKWTLLVNKSGIPFCLGDNPTAFDDGRAYIPITPELLAFIEQDRVDVEPMSKRVDKAEVKKINLWQVQHASRYVYSRDSNFRWVRSADAFLGKRLISKT